MQNRQEPRSHGPQFANMAVVCLYWSQEIQLRLEALYENSNSRLKC